MAAKPVDEELCKEKHKAIDEKCITLFRNQDEFFDSLAGLKSFMASQTEISGRISRQLDQLEQRVKSLEDVPKNRWNNAVNTILQFATLLALGVLVAKIGL